MTNAECLDKVHLLEQTIAFMLGNIEELLHIFEIHDFGGYVAVQDCVDLLTKAKQKGIEGAGENETVQKLALLGDFYREADEKRARWQQKARDMEIELGLLKRAHHMLKSALELYKKELGI